MIDKEWMHRGLACCVRHNPALGGIPLGYVAVPDGHPLRRDGIDLDACLDSHGGVTFAGFLWDDPHHRWWVGFDMGHLWLGDVTISYTDNGVEYTSHRTDEECVEEVNFLAQQIAEITDEIDPLQEGEA